MEIYLTSLSQKICSILFFYSFGYISYRGGYGTYLGLPCLIGKSKKESFQFVKIEDRKKFNEQNEKSTSSCA